MNELQIRELLPEDVETVIAYTKRVGGETDNLTFDSDGFPVTAEDEKRILAAMHEDPKSIMIGVFRRNEMVAQGRFVLCQEECRIGQNLESL